jgi:hypothetical protein
MNVAAMLDLSRNTEFTDNLLGASERRLILFAFVMAASTANNALVKPYHVIPSYLPSYIIAVAVAGAVRRRRRWLWGWWWWWWSVLRQVHSLFQTEFSKECDPELPPSTCSIFLLPQGHPTAAYRYICFWRETAQEMY